tara:strand:- start:531 stop:740 length:210 start_codon:yes stop_codon:yes gene_type:complete
LVLTSHSQPYPSAEICEYLKKTFALSDNALELGIKQSIQENAPLSIVLLTYGLITLSDYQEFLHWLDTN